MDLETRQRYADAAREARRRESSVATLLAEPSMGVHDAREALFGIPSDLFGNDPSRRNMRQAVTHGNRLRGLGLMILMVGLLTLVLENILR
jgi:hypothetical protein